MANVLTTERIISRQSVARLVQDSMYIPLANRSFEQDLSNNGVIDHGKTIDFRLPNYVQAFPDSEWSTAPDGNLVERLRQISVSETLNVKHFFNTDELQFEIEKQFEERAIAPIAEKMSVKVDNALAKHLFTWTAYFKGTPSATASTYEDIREVQSFANQLGIPQDRNFVFSSPIYGNITAFNGFQNSFEVKRTTGINIKGMMGRTCGFTLFEAPNAYYHIAGIGDSVATPSGGKVASGKVKTKTFTTDGTAEYGVLTLNNITNGTGVLKVGDKITIVGSKIYSKATETVLQEDSQFTVIPWQTGTNADWDAANQWYNAGATTATEVTIAISPAPIALDEFTLASDPNAAYANLDTALQVGADVYLMTANTGVGSTVKIAYACNLAFNKYALNFGAPIPVAAKDMANWAHEYAKGEGVGMSVYKEGDINTTIPSVKYRARLQYGYKILPEYTIMRF
jgi:hypothetical protein